MGKKNNKYKKSAEGAGGGEGAAGGPQQPPAQAPRPQQAQAVAPTPSTSGQQPQQQAGPSGSVQNQQGTWGNKQQPQQQGQQQRPQQQRGQQPQQYQQQRPQQQQGQHQQQRPQQGPPQQQGQHQQQRPQQGPPQQQGQPPQQYQQHRPQQQQGQQQRPQQQQGQHQQQRPQQGPPQQQGQQPQQYQQHRPQQQQGQQQRPQQQQGQQQQYQRPQQQQGQQQQQYQRPQQQQGQQQRPQSSAQSRTPSTSSSTSVSSVSGIQRGTAGNPGTVDTNYLRLNLDKMPSTAYHYDVTITPDRPKKFMRPAFEKFNFLHFKDIVMAYDGKKSAYSIQKLPTKEVEKEVELDDSGSRKITLKVTIKETDNVEIDLNSLRNYHKERVFDKPMRALQCLEVVLANACHNRGVRAGRSFFMKPDTFYDLSDGYEMWTGLYQAAILGDQPFLNVDISHKSFPSESWLTDYLQNNCRADLRYRLDDRAVRNLLTFLKMVNIVYEPPKCFGSYPRTYKVNNVSAESADSLSFTLDDGKKMTVAQYFASKGYQLKYPKLNCLHVGSTVKNNFIPLELCKIPEGQTLNKKDGPKQVQKMIRYSATSTNVRKDKIMNMLRHFNHNQDPKIIKFGIQIGANFISVPMRLLASPIMEYFGKETIRPMNGSWRMQPSTQFLNTQKPSAGHKWALIYSQKGQMNYNIMENLARMLSQTATKLNMSLANKPEIKAYDRVDTKLCELKKEKYDLVIVLLPKFGTSYADIKQSAELRHGVLTQCIKEETVLRRLDQQLILNLLLKINAKLNGTNHKICANTHVPLQNVMYVGADVTHPSPDQKNIPSVVGVAASHDANGACYNMQYRLQSSAVEIIEDMDSIFTHHMKIYFKYQNRYPDHVIYYRDGVSDGQFPLIKDNELRGMRSACTRLRVSPKITCIIVVKRHHTRFFPQTVGRDKFNNVTPGTVVDQVIVHPNEVQFFMVSHQSIQGTAKPTRYNVIQDDANLNIDLLQKLTNNLCHLFPRCNRVVSYPAPAYLAHLVAYRGRVYLEGQYNFGELKREYEKRLIKTEFTETNPMFFV